MNERYVKIYIWIAFIILATIIYLINIIVRRNIKNNNSLSEWDKDEKLEDNKNFITKMLFVSGIMTYILSGLVQNYQMEDLPFIIIMTVIGLPLLIYVANGLIR